MSASSRRREAARAQAAEWAAVAERQKREAADADNRRTEEDRQKVEQEQKARQTFNTPSSFYGMSDSFNASAKGWLDSNKDNPTVGAAGADLAYNVLKSTAQRESDVSYAKAMTPLAIDYQRSTQGIASEAEDRRIKSQSNADIKLDKQRGDVTRYGYDKEVEGTKYSADRQVEGVKYSADAQKYGYDSQERQIGLTGQEQRKTLRQGTEETLALRRDARGAIASGGRRFYG